MSKFKSALDRFWGISERGSKFSTEIIAGITTFLTMAYIITVNPGILAGGSPMYESVYIATVLSAGFATLLMALYARAPYAVAAGMGLNAFVAFSLTPTMGSYGAALNVVVIGGLICVILSLTGFREKLLNSVPEAIRAAIPVGIGLFIAFVGLQNASFIVNDDATLVKLVEFNDWKGFLSGELPAAAPALVCLLGVIVIAILDKLHVKGSILIGIAVATLIGIPLKVTTAESFSTYGWLPAFDKFFTADANVSGAYAFWSSWGVFADKFTASFSSALGIIVTILSLAMIDLFDTFGTLLGTAKKGNLIDENGNIYRFRQTLLADSVATVFGAAIGTSNVTTYVESAAGISAGGKTGLTALVVSLFFFLALFLTPVFAAIPMAAAASALVYVGVLMMSAVKDIDFDDPVIAVSAFVTIIFQPLSYSITDGIGLGILVYCFVKFFVYIVNIIKYAINKKEKPAWEIHPVTGVICILFLLYFFVPTSF